MKKELSKLVVMPNGDLKQVQINGWFIPIDGVKTDSDGCYNNPNWIPAEDIAFGVVKDWMENYRPFNNCRLF